MKGYAKLCIRKITDIVVLGMQNESCRKYPDVENVIGRIGLLWAFEISLKSRTCVKRRHEQKFQRHGGCFLLKKLVCITEINYRALRFNHMDCQ